MRLQTTGSALLTEAVTTISTTDASTLCGVAKQRLFGRYTQWNSGNIGAHTYGNGLVGGDPISPESFKTRQVVFGDTYLFSPSLLGDLRLSYLRWTYVRTPGTLGYNETQLGFPAYMGTISQLNNVANSTTVPSIALSTPTYNGVGTGYIFGTNQDYVDRSEHQQDDQEPHHQGWRRSSTAGDAVLPEQLPRADRSHSIPT